MLHATTMGSKEDGRRWSLSRAQVRASGLCTTLDRRTKCGRTRRRNGPHATAKPLSEAYGGLVDQSDGADEELLRDVPSGLIIPGCGGIMQKL